MIVDVTKQETIDSSFDTISKWVADNKQPFVALVNNAGVSDGGPVEMTPLKVYRDGMSLHINSAFP